MNEEKILEYLEILRDLIHEIEKEISNQDNKEKEKKFYTIQEFSAITGLHPTTVWKAVKANKIPANRVGKKYLIPSNYIHKI